MNLKVSNSVPVSIYRCFYLHTCIYWGTIQNCLSR